MRRGGGSWVVGPRAPSVEGFQAGSGLKQENRVADETGVNRGWEQRMCLSATALCRSEPGEQKTYRQQLASEGTGSRLERKARTPFCLRS